jgi:CAAX protease family protein
MLTHLRGHLLLFDRRSAPSYAAGAGTRLLLAAAIVEAVRVVRSIWLYRVVPLWLFMPLVLALAILLVTRLARVRLSQIGFRSWRDWTPTEKSYFCQLVIIANVVFPLVFAAPIRRRLAEPHLAWSLWSGFVPYLFFGFYQEVVYRGMVQTELVRRWGAFAGILVANVLYTFGPLHWYYFASRASLAVPMFAGIFAIGLFFGAVYWRSGNLWIAAVAHAIGNAYIVWSVGPVR